MAFIDDFKTKFPEFDTAKVDSYFATSENDYQCYFGAIYQGNGECDDQAILMLQAHLFVLSEKTGTSALKDTASKSVDGVSVSYVAPATTSQSDAFFSSTKYGQRYMQIRAFNFGGCFV